MAGQPPVGSVTRKLAPPPAAEPTAMRPLWKTTIFCSSARPRPVPLRFSVKKGWKNYVTTVREVEHLTGFDFFSEVPKAIQEVIETRKDAEE